MGKLDGKVAFISGGARGQGRSHALRLAEEGADIIVFDICEQMKTIEIRMARKADLDETAEMIRGLGRRVVAMKADVRDTSSLQAVVEAGLAEFGHIDIVLANAGVTTWSTLRYRTLASTGYSISNRPSAIGSEVCPTCSLFKLPLRPVTARPRSSPTATARAIQTGSSRSSRGN